VTLGRYSMARYFPNAKISAIHGQARTVNGRVVVAMFHPAAGLRSAVTYEQMVADFKKLPEIIAKAQKEAQPPDKGEGGPAQLSLF
jgi:DNA polymerase